ncbi:MAG: cytochrome c [Lacibacter sp.]
MKKVFLFAVLSATAVLSCARKSTPQSTPGNDATTEVKAPVVEVAKFETSVKSLITAKCGPCHIPSAGGKKVALDNLQDAKKWADEIVKRIQMNPGERGYMPFKNPKLSDAEIAVFKQWVKDGMN